MPLNSNIFANTTPLNDHTNLPVIVFHSSSLLMIHFSNTVAYSKFCFQNFGALTSLLTYAVPLQPVKGSGLIHYFAPGFTVMNQTTPLTDPQLLDVAVHAVFPSQPWINFGALKAPNSNSNFSQVAF